MDIWLFGQKIESFKPLRYSLGPETIQKIKLSNKLIDKGWNVNKFKELLISKCFVDPKYQSCIRYMNDLFVVNGFIIEDIIPSQNYDQHSISSPVIVCYSDFIKDNKLKFEETNIKGISSNWINEDLLEEGKFLNQNNDEYVFSTTYFTYHIDSKFNVIRILLNYNGEIIRNIYWNDERLVVECFSENIYLSYDDYLKWLKHLEKSYFLKFPVPETLPYRFSSMLEFIGDNWIIHPKIKKMILKNEENLEKFIHLCQNDWKNNAFFLTYDNGKCQILGWRFLYVWEGLVLVDILTPNNEQVKQFQEKNDYFILNKKYYTSLRKHKPDQVSELVVGNLILILDKELIFNLELHDHALLRYEQRVNENDYLDNILYQILNDVYDNGRVYEGAHTSDRRKIITERYGYILSDTYVISVWTKNNQKIIKNKRRMKRSQTKLNK